MSTRARWTIRTAGAALAVLGITIGALWLAGVFRPGPGFAGTAAAHPDTT